MGANTLGLETIAVDDLCVGMFVHLDLGWLAHPFALGSFRIANDAQIATIRSLGLDRLRWSPAQSELLDPEPAAPAASDRDASSAEAKAESKAESSAESKAEASAESSAEASAQSSAESKAEATGTHRDARAAVPGARQAQRRALLAQRSAQRACERQFTQSARAWRQLTAQVPTEPAEARLGAERLAQSLVDGMTGERDVCIRLLTETAGDKASTHALNVSVIALLMGRASGLPADELRDLGVGALLHDIGKIDLPERIRHRDAAFTSVETRGYEAHVVQGLAHARRMALAPGAALVIAQHHELADGSGFPRGLRGDCLAPAGRIVALANAYDELCNPHNPAMTLTPHEALALLFARGQAKFDTAILGAFIRMMGVYPAGSAVQLTDDRHALVVGINSSRPLKPRVMVYDVRVPRDDALVLDLETTPGVGIRRSLRPAQLPAAALQYLAPRPQVAYFFEAMPIVQAEPALA